MIKKTILFLSTIFFVMNISACAFPKQQNYCIGPKGDEATLGGNIISECPTQAVENVGADSNAPIQQDENTEAPTGANSDPTDAPAHVPTEAPTNVPTEMPIERSTEASTELPTQPTPTDPPINTSPPNSTPSNEASHIHTFGAYQVSQFKSPSSTSPGEIFRFCECGHRDSREIPSLDYNVTDPVTGEHICALYSVSVLATCLKPYHSLTLCTGCDYISEYMDPSSQLANHAYSDWTVTKEATATEQGEQSRTCAVCGKVNTEIIPATSEQRESYIDPSLSFYTSSNGARCYVNTYCHIVDTRTWGDPPSITVYDEYSLHVEYYKQSGEMVAVDVDAIVKQYYSVVCIIAEDGSYSIHVNYTNFQ